MRNDWRLVGGSFVIRIPKEEGPNASSSIGSLTDPVEN
jgi:hypothetical protein